MEWSLLSHTCCVTWRDLYHVTLLWYMEGSLSCHTAVIHGGISIMSHLLWYMEWSLLSHTCCVTFSLQLQYLAREYWGCIYLLGISGSTWVHLMFPYGNQEGHGPHYSPAKQFLTSYNYTSTLVKRIKYEESLFLPKNCHLWKTWPHLLKLAQWFWIRNF